MLTDRRPQFNEIASQCTILPAPLAERDREDVSRIKRSQAPFKKYLFIQDRCCAITGESTAAALDAAHIRAAAANGPELPNNGLLLRADLHRLYDAELFEIAPDGSIIPISAALPAEYKAIPQGRMVSPEIVDRIGAAL